jgi:CO/xanthine dehydrogenase FAD-binding subunit
MQDVSYYRPSSIKEAIKILSEHGPTAKVLAGGTDVIVQARERTKKITAFVDIKKIPDVMGLGIEGHRGLTIGAATPMYQIYDHSGVQEEYPAIIDSANIIGGKAVQGRASLGGNLCNGSPAADTIPTLIVLEGTANIIGPNGERKIAIEDFCTGPGRTLLEHDEILISLHFKRPAPFSGSRFIRFIPRNEMDIAVVNVASQVQMDGKKNESSRISIGACAPTPLLLNEISEFIQDKDFSEELIKDASVLFDSLITPIEDMRGSPEHRVDLAKTLFKRTMNDAVIRSKGEKVQ